MPEAVLDVLIIYALISATLMGFAMAGGPRRHLAASVMLFILVSTSISLIIDLDRPRRGAILISDEPFVRASDQIRAMEAEKLKAPR